MDWFSRIFRNNSVPPADGPNDDDRDGNYHGHFGIQNDEPHFSIFGNSIFRNSDGFFNGSRSENQQSPRDFLLKKSEKSDSTISPHDPSYGCNVPFSSPDQRLPSSPFSEDFFDKSDAMGQDFGIFSFANPFQMMDDMMKSFDALIGPSQFFSDFEDNHHAPFETPRDKNEDRIDKDIDESSANAAALLKEGPTYSHGGYFGADLQPSFGFKYKTTSIVRVRKPDGTIEEKRKYSDSSGREEETITTHEPSGTDDQNPSQSSNSLFEDRGNYLFTEDRGIFRIGGLFSWIPTRW